MDKQRVRVGVVSLVFCATLLSSWVTVDAEVYQIVVPPIAPLDPIYELPKISLAEKEEVLFEAIIERHLNRQGYLLYQSYLPFSLNVTDPNYQLSHNSADLPAWHGYWMAALAMRLAVEGPSPEVEDLLRRAVEGLRTNFDATGIIGLLARAYLEYDGDEPLPWMATKDTDPTKYWQKGQGGFWFRNGAAKDHYSGAVFGLATIIALENRGAINVDPDTRMLVHRTLLDLAHYLIDNKYRIIDANGNVTEFGRLDDWPVNGFNGLQLLAMLRAGKAIDDEKCDKEYRTLIFFGASKTVATTLGALGDFYARVGRENAFGHFSDDQAIYSNALALFVNSDQKDEEVLEDVQYALEKMWQFLRYSLKSYMTFIQSLFSGVSNRERRRALLVLWVFPDDKRAISNLELEDTHIVQPIPNQRINSHYWKTDYFRKASLTPASGRLDVEYSGQDYLIAYWMGRYFGLISEEQANNARITRDDSSEVKPVLGELYP